MEKRDSVSRTNSHNSLKHHEQNFQDNLPPYPATFIWPVAKICVHTFDGQETRGKYHNWGYSLPAEIGRKFAQPGNDKTWFIELQAQLSWYQRQERSFQYEQRHADKGV